MELTEQESQLIQTIREQEGKGEFSLLIECESGAWDITMSATLDDKLRKGRGTGATFDAAWDDIASLRA